MDIADSCFTMIMECHLLRCIGNIDSIIWSADTMTFTGCRCQTLRLMYADTPIARIWQNRNESQDIAVPHGAFGYIGHNECVHAYRIR